MLQDYFSYDERLGIFLPSLKLDWEDYSFDQQQMILTEWEYIRGEIPDLIKRLEFSINDKQEKLNHESDFVLSCKLNSDIADLASIINDLWIWFRSNQQMSNDTKIHG
ncbi:hypothetical protein [Bacillus sp. AFS017336]|uniref:hypothetical protein n=1 Tax=Bacillus sp. AFS017336 TaxID=2033489 RepID=UPI000BF0CFB4|nr:hypothetical protein [Bacillus sp. AFS017336]PEL12548.1 hypothetical protein CN601_07880 [Bacillus sp. AFS017336]